MASEFFSVIQCHHEMGSASNCRAPNGNRNIGIMATGDDVHTVMATENENDVFTLPTQCKRTFFTTLNQWLNGK